MISALTTLQQWLLFTGTTLVIGCVAWRVQVLPGALRSLSPEAAPEIAGVERRVASLALASAAVVVVAWVLRLVVQVMGFRDPFVPLWEDVSFLLFEIPWGTVWMAQGGVVIFLVGAIWLARHAGGGRDGVGGHGLGVGWGVASALVPGLAATLALSGHAAGVDSGRGLALTADAVHTLAAGSWIGALAVILILGRASESGSPTVFAAQIRSFSPMALVSGALLVSMGVFLAWKHLQTVSDLWTLTYGRILSAKIAIVVVIFSLGFLNWRRGIPICDTPEGATEVRRRALWEVSLAVAVIFLTAILVHSTKP